MRKYETLTKDLLISWGISDIKINEESIYGYDIYDRWGKKRKIQIIGSYPGVICYKNGERHFISLHRGVYAWFVGPIEKGMDIDHIDDNRMNPRLDNLQKITHAENIQKGYDRKKKG